MEDFVVATHFAWLGNDGNNFKASSFNSSTTPFFNTFFQTVKSYLFEHPAPPLEQQQQHQTSTYLSQGIKNPIGPHKRHKRKPPLHNKLNYYTFGFLPVLPFALLRTRNVPSLETKLMRNIPFSWNIVLQLLLLLDRQARADLFCLHFSVDKVLPDSVKLLCINLGIFW